MCPFKVGDRIETPSGPAYPAKVTSVSEIGFEYVYDVPVPWISRTGTTLIGGTSFPEGYAGFKLISVDEPSS